MRWPTVVLLIAACAREPVPRGDLPDTAYGSERPDVEIAVSGPDGQPIEGAWVTLSPGGRDAQADALGHAVLPGVEEGAYEVQVAADGFARLSAPIEVGPSGFSLAVSLGAADASARLEGLVTDPYGAPVGDVAVEVDGVEVARTGLDGRYFATGLAEGAHAVAFVPDASRLAGWYVPEVSLVEAGTVEVVATLPGRPTDAATYVGSTGCLFCHGGGTDPGGKWFDSAHARASSPPSEWEGTELGDAVDGTVVSLAPAVPDGTVTFAKITPGQWTAAISDGTNSTAAYPVVEVYGGHRSGAALAVSDGTSLRILPVVWGLAGQGLSSRQDPAEFVPAYTDGWFDAFGALLLVATPESSFDLQCAGCHATGHSLTTASSKYNLAPTTTRGVLERRIGCEACHGPGSEHTSRPDIARLTIFQPGRAAPTDRLETCARCHERVSADDHPFAADPAWPVDAAGKSIRADAVLSDFATATPTWWAAVPASRVLGDQVGEFRGSPHRTGAAGYDGACEDCHDPHGSDRPSALRRDPWDNGLCVQCHVTRFPDTAAQRAHASHSVFAPGPWGPGTCTGCHMARSGVDVRLDAVSLTGELHSHGLMPFDPDDVLVEFDLAGDDHLLAGEVPTGGCLDCHHQVDAERRDAGDVCACPQGDPLYRVTWQNLGTLYDTLWGAP